MAQWHNGQSKPALYQVYVPLPLPLPSRIESTLSDSVATPLKIESLSGFAVVAVSRAMPCCRQRKFVVVVGGPAAAGARLRRLRRRAEFDGAGTRRHDRRRGDCHRRRSGGVLRPPRRRIAALLLALGRPPDSHQLRESHLRCRTRRRQVICPRPRPPTGSSGVDLS